MNRPKSDIFPDLGEKKNGATYLFSNFHQAFLVHVLEPMVFRNADLFTVETLNQLADLMEPTTDRYFRYFLFFLSTRQATRLDIKTRADQLLEAMDPVAFPLHQKVKKILGSEEKRVLLVHNLQGGRGDEQMRTHSLIRALLALNPDIQIDVVTAIRGRKSLYPVEDGRVTVCPVLDTTTTYDMVVEMANSGEGSDTSLRDLVGRMITDKKPSIYVRARGGLSISEHGRQVDDFHIARLEIEGENLLDQFPALTGNRDTYLEIYRRGIWTDRNGAFLLFGRNGALLDNGGRDKNAMKKEMVPIHSLELLAILSGLVILLFYAPMVNRTDWYKVQKGL